MSSKRRIRKNQCGKKTRYKDKEDAAAALSSLYNRTGYKGHTYKCRWCGKWHIGRRPEG